MQCGFNQGRNTLYDIVRFETFILEDSFDMGLKSSLPNFISNFLFERKFNVRVNSAYSDKHEQEIGVPHGSILSVILFSIKINSLAKTSNYTIEGSVYVDDFPGMLSVQAYEQH